MLAESCPAVWLLSWAKALIAFATITVPRLMYFILSYSLTLTVRFMFAFAATPSDEPHQLNFWSFAIIFVLSGIALNYWIRFRYLDVYKLLKEPPLTKPDANELHPDVNTTEPVTSFHNYLDDFLQAVRVFGFLEKPVSDNYKGLRMCSLSRVQVFHELARHLQTRRLIAGDSIELDQDKSFYCVVDGMVQVFAQTGQPPDGFRDEDDMNGYQLLNEVGNGGTLSSLFTILSLFTEEVKMSWQDEPIVASPSSDASSLPRSDISHLELGPNKRHPRRRSSASTVHAKVLSSPISDARLPHLPLPSDFGSLPKPGVKRAQSQMHHGVIARATEDSTLAVIPAEAFRGLTKKFPKAAGHIMQGFFSPALCL
jgi:lysophospholipid hydrolase